MEATEKLQGREEKEGGEREGKQVATAIGCPAETSDAGKADVCKGCPGRELCLSGVSAVDTDQKFIDVRMKAVGRKILILSGKGGVGKSSIASSLSIALARLSAKVGLVDVDICGPSIPKLMSVDCMDVVSTQYGWTPLISPHHHIKVMSVGSLLQERDSAVVWRGPRKTALIKRFLKDTFWGRLDYLIFDTPPGTSDEHLSIVKALMNAKPEGAIIVTSPQEVALATIRKEINFCRKMKLNIIGIVENMSGYQCPCCKEVWPVFPTGEGGGARGLAEEYGLPLLATIPLDPMMVQCCEQGQSIFQDNTHQDKLHDDGKVQDNNQDLGHFSSTSPAANALTELARMIHLGIKPQ